MKTFKNILIKAGFAFLLVGVTSSCDSWLYLEPQDAIVKQEFWKTKEQVKSAVYGAYSSLLGGTAPTIGEQMFLWGELRADMILPNPQASQSEIEITNGNITDMNPIVNWRAFYRTINYCNTVMEFAPAARDIDKTFEEAELNGYLGEMRTMRAMLYFYLVRSFGDVPFKLDATVSDDQDLQIPKTPQAEILRQIRRELVQAEKETPLTHGSRELDKGRLTKYAVNALQADVYLWSELYDSAIIAAKKIEDSGKFRLVPGNTWHRSLFVTGNSDESIFEIQFGTQRHPYFLLLSPGQRFGAAPFVLEELYTIDFANPANRDFRADGSSLRSDGSIWKYMGSDADTRRTNVAPYPNFIVYRLADILLFKAEALNQVNQGVAALELVERVRLRANALEATKKTLDPTTEKDAIADYILEERARELAYEGKRWYDVLRNAKRNNYERENILLETVLRSAPIERQQTIITKYKDHRSHYFPIFAFEIQTNKNLVQNPFYK